MALKQLTDDLEARGVRYWTRHHFRAVTAQRIAAATHIPGRELAKTVMIQLDGELVMAVVRAVDRIDLRRFASRAGGHEAHLAKEAEFAHVFPGCEVGAMPPFGNLWSIPVYVSDTLANDEDISFAAGTHSEIMTIAFQDYARVVNPTVLPFTRRIFVPRTEPHAHA